MFFLNRKLVMSGGVASHELDVRSFAAGIASALPAGIVRSPEDFHGNGLDFTLEDPVNMWAADQVLGRIAVGMREAMHPEGTLYVVMGETHFTPAHILAQAGMMDTLAAKFNECADPRYKTALALETAFNQLARRAAQHYKLRVSKAQRYALHKHDPRGHIFACAVLADNRHSSPAARSRLWAAALDGKMKIALADAANICIDSSYYLDPRDPMAASVAKEMYGINMAQDKLPCTSSTPERDIRGIDVRNEVLARRIAEAAKGHGIVVTQTGLSHLGDKRRSLDFANALPARLAEHLGPHDRILTLFPTAARDGFTPENLTPPGAHPHIIPMVLRGLSDTKFREVNEEDFVQELGFSYPKGSIPARFQPLPLPDRDEIKAELQALLNAHPCVS